MLVNDGSNFKKVVTGKNFMTPTIINYYTSGNYDCELSKGTGIPSGTIYGVTVVDTENKIHSHDLSKMFKSLAEAKAYIKNLGKL